MGWLAGGEKDGVVGGGRERWGGWWGEKKMGWLGGFEGLCIVQLLDGSFGGGEGWDHVVDRKIMPFIQWRITCMMKYNIIQYKHE